MKFYNILIKREKRERRNFIFLLVYRSFVIILLVLIVLFPQFFIEKIFQISEPIIKNMIIQVFETQKEKLSDVKDNLLNSVKTLNIGQ